jgi:PAS domain S-box-containing protein
MEPEIHRSDGEGWHVLVQGILDYAIFLLDAGGRVLAWNAGSERILGYAAPEIVGQHWSRLYVRDEVDRRRPQRHLETAIAEGRFEEDGWRVDSRGARLWVNVVVRPLYDDAGRPQGFVSVLREATARRRPAQERRALLAERERIARELYARTIRTFFAVGLQLNGLANRIDNAEIGELLEQCTQQLDDGIAELRRLAFDLGRPTP